MFDCGYPEIAAIVGKSEDNVRSWQAAPGAMSSRTGPASSHARAAPGAGAAVLAAAERGDLAGLEALLARDVELTGDGGGKAPALAQTLGGRNRVAPTLFSWLSLDSRPPGLDAAVEINGWPGRSSSTASSG